jgi:hypothetical protein
VVFGLAGNEPSIVWLVLRRQDLDKPINDALKKFPHRHCRSGIISSCVYVKIVTDLETWKDSNLKADSGTMRNTITCLAGESMMAKKKFYSIGPWSTKRYPEPTSQGSWSLQFWSESEVRRGLRKRER